MYEFEYQKPASIEEAKSLLASGDDPKILAGGQTLLPTMKQRLAMPTHLVDISALMELKGILDDGASIVIGAGEKHADVAGSAIVKNKIPALAALAGRIGDPHVRHMGSLGGSIANNDPTADYPAALLGLSATIHTSDRTIEADDFIKDFFETTLEENEIVTKVSFPVPETAAYVKFPNPASRYALVGVFIAKTPSGVRVAVTGAGPCVFRVAQMEAALASNFSAAALEGLSVPATDLNGDLHASPEYRAHLIGVMAKRAMESIS